MHVCNCLSFATISRLLANRLLIKAIFLNSALCSVMTQSSSSPPSTRPVVFVQHYVQSHAAHVQGKNQTTALERLFLSGKQFFFEAKLHVNLINVKSLCNQRFSFFVKGIRNLPAFTCKVTNEGTAVRAKARKN